MAVSTPTRTNLTTGETGTRALGAGHLYLPPPLRDIPNRPCTMLVPRNTHSSQFGFGYPYFFQLSLPFSQGLERGHFRPLGSKHSGAWLYPPVYFKNLLSLPPPPHAFLIPLQGPFSQASARARNSVPPQHGSGGGGANSSKGKGALLQFF